MPATLDRTSEGDFGGGALFEVNVGPVCYGLTRAGLVSPSSGCQMDFGQVAGPERISGI